MAMRDTQDPSGRFADIAPIGGGFGGILWGSAGITAAYESYLQYKDTDMLSEHYNAMKRYVDYLDTRRDPGTGIINEGPLGDWLAPEYVLNETALLFTAYYAYDLRILSKMAWGFLKIRKSFGKDMRRKRNSLTEFMWMRHPTERYFQVKRPCRAAGRLL